MHRFAQRICLRKTHQKERCQNFLFKAMHAHALQPKLHALAHQQRPTARQENAFPCFPKPNRSEYTNSFKIILGSHAVVLLQCPRVISCQPQKRQKMSGKTLLS